MGRQMPTLPSAYPVPPPLLSYVQHIVYCTIFPFLAHCVVYQRSPCSNRLPLEEPEGIILTQCSLAALLKHNTIDRICVVVSHIELDSPCSIEIKLGPGGYFSWWSRRRMALTFHNPDIAT